MACFVQPWAGIHRIRDGVRRPLAGTFLEAAWFQPFWQVRLETSALKRTRQVHSGGAGSFCADVVLPIMSLIRSSNPS